jgi:hypothetical protein
MSAAGATKAGVISIRYAAWRIARVNGRMRSWSW